jgi:hypothetical protein
MARSLSYPLIALLALPLASQAVDNTYPRVSVFYGTASTLGDSGNQKVRESVHIGLEYSHPVWKGHVFATAEWRTFRSRNREVTQFSPRQEDGTHMVGDAYKSGYAGVGSGQRGYITAFTRSPFTIGQRTPTQAQLVAMFPGTIAADWPTTNPPLQHLRDYGIMHDGRFDSVHMAKNDIGGGSSRIGYRHPLNVPLLGEIGLQGGLTFSFFTTEEFAAGDIHVLDGRDWQQNLYRTAYTSDNPLLDNIPGLSKRLYNDVFYQMNKDNSMLPGAFLGARWNVNDNFYFETNFVFLGVSEPTYVPTAYTGGEAFVDSSTSMKMVWEFNAGFRF